MDFLTLTQSNWFIIGPVAKLLGWVMNAIYNFLDAVSLPSIGFSIILFTVIIRVLMLPLSIKQQKFAKLNTLMQPEMQRIQKKYANKKDNASLMKQQEELKEVYAKYGTSPTGSCLQMLIQMPVLFALYQVIYKIPGYVVKVKELYVPIQTALMNINDWASNSSLVELAGKHTVSQADLTGGDAANRVIDLLYTLNQSEWPTLTEIFNNNALTNAVNQALPTIDQINNFFGINLATPPLTQMTNGVWWAVLIPILAGGAQWFSSKMMSTNNGQTDESAPGAGMMKSMNTIFPLMSVFFCFTFSAGIGIYWIMGSVMQILIQLVVNAHMERIDLNQMVAKNIEKMNAKRAKDGLPPKKATPVLNVKNLEEEEKNEKEEQEIAAERQKRQIEQSTQYYNSANGKKGSLASKAGMVQQYNEKNMKKKK